jgi:hypothetical protein
MKLHLGNRLQRVLSEVNRYEGSFAWVAAVNNTRSPLMGKRSARERGYGPFRWLLLARYAC